MRRDFSACIRSLVYIIIDARGFWTPGIKVTENLQNIEFEYQYRR